VAINSALLNAPCVKHGLPGLLNDGK